MELIEQVKICKEWFKSNNISCPSSVTAWSTGKSGKDYPPKFSKSTVEKTYGLKIKDIIQAIRGSTEVSVCEAAGLQFLGREKKETIRFICMSCKETKSTLLSTIKRWVNSGHLYCSECRGASGKVKKPEYYQKFLAPEFKPMHLYGSKLHILHTVCGSELVRDTAYIITLEQRADTKLLQCPVCKNLKCKVEGYLSLVESSVIPYILDKLPKAEIIREAYYSTFQDTTRNFRADLYLPQYKTVIEITSKNNNLPGYSARILEKKTLCHENGIKFFLVTDIHEAKDIVQSLLKDREI